MLSFLFLFQDYKEDIFIQFFNSNNHICRVRSLSNCPFVKSMLHRENRGKEGWMNGRKKQEGLSSVVLCFPTFFQDQCRQVQNEAEDAKFRQLVCSLASVARISTVSLSPELREDFLKTSLKKLLSQKGTKSCSLSLSHFLG